MVVDRKYRNALALPCLMCEPLPNTANSSDVLRLDSMLRELRKPSYCVTINTGVFLATMCSNRRKNMVVDRENQKALALLGLASRPLPNAVNSSVVPTEFAAEPTT